jgi:hypothetical protein
MKIARLRESNMLRSLATRLAVTRPTTAMGCRFYATERKAAPKEEPVKEEPPKKAPARSTKKAEPAGDGSELLPPVSTDFEPGMLVFGLPPKVQK